MLGKENVQVISSGNVGVVGKLSSTDLHLTKPVVIKPHSPSMKRNTKLLNNKPFLLHENTDGSSEPCMCISMVWHFHHAKEFALLTFS